MLILGTSRKELMLINCVHSLENLKLIQNFHGWNKFKLALLFKNWNASMINENHHSLLSKVAIQIMFVLEKYSI